MADWTLELGALGDGVLGRLADMLDNPKRGWRQLAAAVTERPRFRCSEKELLSCSLQVLSATGSPSRFLLAMLADRSCPLSFLLHCLKKMEHHAAVQYLTAAGERPQPGSALKSRCARRYRCGQSWEPGDGRPLAHPRSSACLQRCCVARKRDTLRTAAVTASQKPRVR
ncbi:hypothetical protein Z043_125497 [Scleropages formosus]|uniref:Uncharacterized protein n=1 Tax=Scleropages formosus TaxID=113540 RepID=A0A0P7XVC3_SCLFO|nr:hypothetical protein Z043_125497 [Scleropages formosus]